MTGRRFPGFSFKHPKLDCEQRGASGPETRIPVNTDDALPLCWAFFKTRKTFLRLHVRQTRNQIPRQVNAQACAKQRSKSRRFPLGIACFFLLRQSLLTARLPCQRYATLSPQQTATHFLQPPSPDRAADRTGVVREPLDFTSLPRAPDARNVLFAQRHAVQPAKLHNEHCV